MTQQALDPCEDVRPEAEFAVHAVKWTREKSSRWWDVHSKFSALQARHFALMVGNSVIDFLQARIKFGGRLIDFGCGPGYFLELLAARGIHCEGADFSPESLQACRRRMMGSPFFHGVSLLRSMYTHFADETFDTLFLMETIEHILDGELEASINELHRIIKPNGLIIVTTPNEEDLEPSQSICPDCGCVYHPVQHVRSWTAKELEDFMSGHGFATVLCQATYFHTTWVRQKVRTVLTKLLGRKLPNLVYVGRKAQADCERQ